MTHTFVLHKRDNNAYFMHETTLAFIEDKEAQFMLKMCLYKAEDSKVLASVFMK